MSNFLNRVYRFFLPNPTPETTNVLPKQEAQNGSGATDRPSLRYAIDKIKKVQNSYKFERPDIGQLARAIETASQPPFYIHAPLMRLYNSVFNDADLFASFDTMVKMVQAEQMYVKFNGEINEDILSKFRAQWFTNFIRYFLEVNLFGFSAIEFELSGKGKDIQIEVVNIDRVLINPVTREALLNYHESYGVSLDNYPDTLLIYPERYKFGVLEKLAKPIIYKDFVGRDWSLYIGTYYMPLLSYMTNETDEQKLAQLASELAETVANRILIAREGDKLEITESTKNSASDVFDKFIERVVMQIDKNILGATMITANGASLSQSEVHKQILDIRLCAHLVELIYYINGKLIPFLQERKYLPKGKIEIGYRLIDKLRSGENSTTGNAEQSVTATVNNMADRFAKFYGKIKLENTETFANEDIFKATLNKIAQRLISGEQVAFDAELADLIFQNYIDSFNNVWSGEAMPQSMIDNIKNFAAHKAAQIIDKLAFELQISSNSETIIGQINNTYNNVYFAVEKAHIINTMNQVVFWKKFDAAKSRYNAKYVAVMDGRTRPNHAALNGIVQDYNSDFFKNYAPPLEWGCRCYLVLVLKDQYEISDLPQDLPKIADSFKTNFGKEQISFSEKHPYFDVKSSSEKEIKKYLS